MSVADRSTPRGVLAGGLALALVTVLVYLPALTAPLLLDDSEIITPLIEAVRQGHSPWAFLHSASGPFGRPLAMASFILNALSSGDDLRAWRATSIALHLACGALLFGLVRTLARALGQAPPAAAALALGTVALWLVHPLWVSTVVYVTQRMTMLSTVFTLAALWLYARGRTRVAAGGGLDTALALAVCTPLAVAAKETGLLAPYLLLALELTVGERLGPRPQWLRVTLFCVTALPLFVAGTYLATHWQSAVLGPYTMREFTLPERLVTEWRALAAYLGWIVAPRAAALGFYHDDFPVAAWPPDLDTLVCGALLAGLLVGAWGWRARAPLASFGVLLFFVGHALESSVFGLELVFEHRNYLPAAGVCLVLVVAAQAALGPVRQWWLVAPLALMFAMVTASMTPTWGDPGRLHATLLRDHPGSLRARLMAIEWHLGRGEVLQAQLLRTSATAPALALDLVGLRIGCLTGHLDPAATRVVLATAAAAPRPDGYSAQLVSWLATQSLDGACAIEPAELAPVIDTLRERPMSTPVRARLSIASALIHQRLHDYPRAFAALDRAAWLMPDDPYTRYLEAEIAVDAGDVPRARGALSAARTLARGREAEFVAIDRGVAELVPAR